MSGAGQQARRCHRTLEPFHGMVYFVPEATEEYAALGIHGRSGYFLSRSAAMGRVNAATVVATFYNFHPDLVARAMAQAPVAVDVDDVLDARLRAVDRALRGRLGDAVDSASMLRAADLAARAATSLPALSVGRPLGAAHAALPQPADPHLRLWWAVTALREHRGDGHIAALVDAELSGLDALLVHAGSGEVGADVLRSTRAWSDEEWAAGQQRLQDRGVLAPDGSLTAAGAALRQDVEDRTDRLAAPAWEQLSETEATELRELVRPWSRTLLDSIRPG